MATVALTGASGFLGRSLAASLLAADWRVKALLRRPDSELSGLGLEPVPGSLADEAALEALLDGADAVVHAAGLVRARHKRDFATVNAGGTARLARLAAQAATPPRLLLVSSLAARRPELSAYAASKRAAEAALLDLDSPLDRCIVRPPAIYGPGDRATLGLFRQIERGVMFVPARPNARFSLCFVTDVAEAIVGLLAEPAWEGRCFELDDGRDGGYAWADLGRLAAERLRRRIRLVTVPHALLWPFAAVNETAGGALGRAPIFTPGKLRELYHPDWVAVPERRPPRNAWVPRVGFAEGLARTLSWYKDRAWI